MLMSKDIEKLKNKIKNLEESYNRSVSNYENLLKSERRLKRMNLRLAAIMKSYCVCTATGASVDEACIFCRELEEIKGLK
jgi:hypothetical protein